MSASAREKSIIIAQSGNICAFPECNQMLVIEEKSSRSAIVGVAAHIKGENQGAARYDKNMTDDERNSSDNLIFLCQNHHKIIDDQPIIYTVEGLLEMKDVHKKWVIEKTRKSLPSVTFVELEIVTKYLLSNAPTDINIEIITPKEKIKKNQLTMEVENEIISGLSRVKLIKDYINQSIDSEFGEKLKQGFIDEYNRLTEKENLKGDRLFESLLGFASNGNTDFKRRAASLVVLVYFFEQCDIFEK